MILRVWHGWTTSENAAAYQQLLTTSIVPSIISREIPGLVGVGTCAEPTATTRTSSLSR